MATNPVGKGTKTIGINMPGTMATDIETRADSMGVSTGLYCKIVLKRWLESGKKLSLSEQ